MSTTGFTQTLLMTLAVTAVVAIPSGCGEPDRTAMSVGSTPDAAPSADVGPESPAAEPEPRQVEEPIDRNDEASPQNETEVAADGVSTTSNLAQPEFRMEFTHNSTIDIWESKAPFQGREIGIWISSNHAASDREQRVKEAITKTLANWDQIQKNLADSLLETYNEGWADPDDGLPEYTRDEFLKRIVINKIYVMEEGAISLYFDDSDLFAGHLVEIYWNEKKMYEATIEG